MELHSDGATVKDRLGRQQVGLWIAFNMLGRYSFAVPEEVARGELRPLRNPEDDL